jgi:hypothetical protein
MNMACAGSIVLPMKTGMEFAITIVMQTEMATAFVIIS